MNSRPKIVPMTLLLNEEHIKAVFENNKQIALELIEKALMRNIHSDILLPDKISQVFDEETQNRINCMPGTLVSEKISGVKWVAVFPTNYEFGLRNVTGTILLSELNSGYTLSIMDGTYITNLRTAAMGAVAAKYLAPKNAETIGFIGAGCEARNHLDMITIARPTIKKCYVSSRRDSTIESFIEEEQIKHPDIEFIACGNNFEKACTGRDIIVTATSTQADLLKAAWVKKGSLYIHVGGWEDEFAVAEMADKIVCDNWECIKHRTQTISRMYKEGLLEDHDIYANIEEIIAGQKTGRETDEEFIYFCSVGLAFVDMEFAKYAYDYCSKQGMGLAFNLN